MATTFGVRLPDDTIVEVAHRSGAGNGKLKITWLNPLAQLLPPDTHILALDNSAQGMEHIRDLIMYINLNQ